MDNAILKLKFHLRYPYNEVGTLIDAFNQIVADEGRSEICLSPIPKGDYLLDINVYRCADTRSACTLSEVVIGDFSHEDMQNFTKFNFASAYSSPVKFNIEDCDDDEHGPIISIYLFENPDSNYQNRINQQFRLVDLSSK